jgi:uncharacterized protein (DUF58 family)
VNARGPRLLIPSGLLGVALTTLAILAANARRPGEARAILVAAIAVVIADGWLAFRALARLDATMATPAAGRAGTTFLARASIQGVSRPATIDPLFADEEATRFDGPEPFLLVCQPAQRGVFNHLLVEVRCRSPLGLWSAARRVAVNLQRPLWIGPVPRPVGELPPGPAPEATGAGAVHAPGDDVVRSARPYVAGDSSRLVHWPASAREGRLMVRETEAETRPLAVVVVDVQRPGPAAEGAVGRAATAAAAALARDGRVRLITAERQTTEPAASIPRSVLVPAAQIRTVGSRPVPSVTVDAVETSAEAVHRRLAAAVTRPVVVAGPLPSARWFTDEGDHR